MSNHLAECTSPYLLSHAKNPVDWYPWGSEALQRSRQENKPIFLSIGYSACHWCHVMEQECFEDGAVAGVLNAHFVPIKVDREERPDLDETYMEAVQILSGRGGWPMSVWLTPDLKPFYGGTYFPRLAFLDFLTRIAQLWHDRSDYLREEADKLLKSLLEQSDWGRLGAPQSLAVVYEEAAQRALNQLKMRFDSRWGGFMAAPKFPSPSYLELLLRRGGSETASMAELTLVRMWEGGIYDHLAGGFARYSTDDHWNVPHFEKMLYDNAQLIHSYLLLYQVTHQARYASIARECLDYTLRDMRDARGVFYCSEDADSEGEEGRFYLWTENEIHKVLGAEFSALFYKHFELAPTGRYVVVRRKPGAPLGVTDDGELLQVRRRLLEARQKKVKPGKDDKILTSWNALMITALVKAYQALGDRKYLIAAQESARFIRKALFDGEKLWRVWRAGQHNIYGQLEDYGALISALGSLYDADPDPAWLQWARHLADVLLQRFEDTQEGGFFITEIEQKDILKRKNTLWDGAIPSGNTLAAVGLLRLYAHLPYDRYLKACKKIFEAGAPMLRVAPLGAVALINAWDEAASMGLTSRLEGGKEEEVKNSHCSETEPCCLVAP